MFYGFQIDAPWPTQFPKGKIIEEEHRHCTLVFLGKKKLEHFHDFPLPLYHTAPIGLFTDCALLPTHSPRVAAWDMQWLTPGIGAYQKMLEQFFKDKGFLLEKRDWRPHVSIARHPEKNKEWPAHFSPLPFIATGIHLYESLGNSKYLSHWEHRFHPPFEEIPHTADIAYIIYGENLSALFYNAACALAFMFPAITPFISQNDDFEEHDDVIIALNKIVENTDREIGCPFKAVSFSGEVTQQSETLISWEMIIDV